MWNSVTASVSPEPAVSHASSSAIVYVPASPFFRPNAHSRQLATHTLVGLMCRFTLKYAMSPCIRSRTAFAIQPIARMSPLRYSATPSSKLSRSPRRNLGRNRPQRRIIRLEAVPRPHIRLEAGSTSCSSPFYPARAFANSASVTASRPTPNPPSAAAPPCHRTASPPPGGRPPAAGTAGSSRCPTPFTRIDGISTANAAVAGSFAVTSMRFAVLVIVEAVHVAHIQVRQRLPVRALVGRK